MQSGKKDMKHVPLLLTDHGQCSYSITKENLFFRRKTSGQNLVDEVYRLWRAGETRNGKYTRGFNPIVYLLYLS